MSSTQLTRRTLLARGAVLGGVATLGPLFPAWARSGTAGIGPEMPTLSGETIDLTIGHSPFTVGGRTGQAVTINGPLPAPLLRLREGRNVRRAVTNTPDEAPSTPWPGRLQNGKTSG